MPTMLMMEALMRTIEMPLVMLLLLLESAAFCCRGGGGDGVERNEDETDTNEDEDDDGDGDDGTDVAGAPEDGGAGRGVVDVGVQLRLFIRVDRTSRLIQHLTPTASQPHQTTNRMESPCSTPTPQMALPQNAPANPIAHHTCRTGKQTGHLRRTWACGSKGAQSRRVGARRR
eukprot:2373179-Rhodomonas_salina.5